jgi:hypothetical protein
MNPRRVRVTAGMIAVTGLAFTGSVSAQGLAGRVALEAIASASTEARAVDDPFVMLDFVGTVRVANGLDVVVRPWSARRPGGDWMFEMYQLQLRYVSSTRVPFRVDAGIIPSPVGLFTLELQPHRNPLINAPFYYFAPLPKIEGTASRVQLISGGYPLGATVSVSGAHWDARAGITDSTPSDPRNVFSASRPPAHAQLILGGGVAPITGMRVGVGFTRGRYEPGASSSAESATLGPQTATVFNVEGEYAIAHTRLTGEWVRDRFDTPLGAAVARGFNVQATQTLSPRIFAAARATRVSSPLAATASSLRRASTSLETTLGYRLSTEVTVRAGYQGERGFRDTGWRDAAVMSLVWAQRWW